MQVSFRDTSGVALAAPGKGHGYWAASTPIPGDLVLLGPAVDDDHPSAHLVDRVPVNPTMNTYRVVSRKWLTPSHLFCRVEPFEALRFNIGRLSVSCRTDGTLKWEIVKR